MDLGLPSVTSKFSREVQLSGNLKDQGEEEDDLQNEKGVELDANIWSRLPEHVLENILAKLPVLSFLRFRAVCKKWNALASKSTFLETFSLTPSRAPLFLLYADHARERYPIYDSALNRWYLLPQTCGSLARKGSRSLVVVASAGGLLCLADESDPVDHDFGLYVFNPMTNAKRQLPPLANQMPNPYVVGMVTDMGTKSYQILMAQNGEHLSLQVYDSTHNTWRMTDGLQKRLALLVGTASANGILYCLSFGTSIDVTAYHTEDERWEDVQAPLPAALAWPVLFLRKGHLSMVGAITDCGFVKNICVWQLDSGRKEWEHVLSVPEDLLEELSRGHWGPHCLFVADEDYICFARHYVKRILMCNISKRTWWWLPRCRSEEYVDELSFAGFSVQPSLDVLV